MLHLVGAMVRAMVPLLPPVAITAWPAIFVAMLGAGTVRAWIIVAHAARTIAGTFTPPPRFWRRHLLIAFPGALAVAAGSALIGVVLLGVKRPGGNESAHRTTGDSNSAGTLQSAHPAPADSSQRDLIHVRITADPGGLLGQIVGKLYLVADARVRAALTPDGANLEAAANTHITTPIAGIDLGADSTAALTPDGANAEAAANTHITTPIAGIDLRIALGPLTPIDAVPGG